QLVQNDTDEQHPGQREHPSGKPRFVAPGRGHRTSFLSPVADENEPVRPMAGVPCPIVASTLPMLRRRRAAVFAGGMAVRLLERAVGIAERVGEAIIVVERAWATRHEIAAAFGSRRTANVTLTEAHTTPENVHESSSAPEHPPVAAP